MNKTKKELVVILFYCFASIGLTVFPVFNIRVFYFLSDIVETLFQLGLSLFLMGSSASLFADSSLAKNSPDKNLSNKVQSSFKLASVFLYSFSTFLFLLAFWMFLFS